MKKNGWKWIWYTVGISCLFFTCVVGMFTACGLFETEDDLELTQEEIQAINYQQSYANVSGSGVNALQTVSLYTIDGINEQLVPLKVPLESSRVTPELIVDKVIENLDEKIVVTEIEVEKQCIYVTFSNEYAPLRKCSENFETLILDCISNSLLDNVPYIEEVVFRSETGAYHSENYEFGEEEVYSSR